MPLMHASHAVLADAPVKVPAVRRRAEVPPLLDVVPVLPPRSAEPPTRFGTQLRKRLQRLAPRPAWWPALRSVESETRQAALPALRQARRSSQRSNSAASSGWAAGSASKRCRQRSMRLAPRCDRCRASAPVRRRARRTGLDGPAQDLLGPPDFVGAQRCAVGLGGVRACRGRIGDVSPEHDQRGPRRLGRRGVAVPRQCRPDRCHRQRAARASRRPRSAPHVFGEAECGVAVDGDVIVVVDQRSACRARRCPAIEAASLATPSMRSPSLRRPRCGGPRSGARAG